VATQHGLLSCSTYLRFPVCGKTHPQPGKIAKGIDDGAEEMALLTRWEGEEGGVVSNDNPGTASSMMDASTRHNGNVPPAGLTNTTTTGAPSQQCYTPPPKQANQSAKKQREVTEINDELMPTRHSTRIAEKNKMASAPKNVVHQRKEAPIAPAKRREVAEINDKLTPSRHSTRIAEKMMASVPKNVSNYRR
jgi:hypothetical protein